MEVGGNGGGEFQNLLPYGFHTVICFGGSCSEYLDSFYVVYKWILLINIYINKIY